jgi:hypothetical protein
VREVQIKNCEPLVWGPEFAICARIIEAPWLVNGGHGASFRHHNCADGEPRHHDQHRR